MPSQPPAHVPAMAAHPAAVSAAMMTQSNVAHRPSHGRPADRLRSVAILRAKRGQEAQYYQEHEREQFFHDDDIVSYHDHLIARARQIFQKI